MLLAHKLVRRVGFEPTVLVERPIYSRLKLPMPRPPDLESREGFEPTYIRFAGATIARLWITATFKVGTPRGNRTLLFRVKTGDSDL